MSKKVLVTGINGFVGHHVATRLRQQGYDVVGVSNQASIEDDLKDKVSKYISCDLTNAEQVKKIDLSGVTAIINLAGFAKVGDSIGKGELCNKINVGVHTVLYDECLRQGVNPRVIAVSTGAVYDQTQPMPITEESRLVDRSKTNEYVISKQLMEESLKKYSDSDLRIIIARPLNHSGPGQLPGFLLPDLGEQIESAASTGKPLKVGDLNTRRDYTDVRDVARAYVELATCELKKLRHNLYNICSGKSIPGTEILRLLTKAFGAASIKIEKDQSRIRPNEVMDMYGSYRRIHNDTGWKPEISVEKMVQDYAAWKQAN